MSSLPKLLPQLRVCKAERVTTRKGLIMIRVRVRDSFDEHESRARSTALLERLHSRRESFDHVRGDQANFTLLPGHLIAGETVEIDAEF